MAQNEPEPAGQPGKKRRKRKFNPGMLALVRGSPASYGHNRITELITKALKEEGEMWYDHIVVPGVPATLEPVPVRFKHFSPNPDVVIKTMYGKGEMWMIHIQRVYPIRRIPKKTTVPGDYEKIGNILTMARDERRKRERQGK